MDYYIVAYDISDPKRLQKVYKAMKDFGQRLQFSVFGCYLNRTNLVLMKERLSDLISFEDDRLIIIRCCPSCTEGIETLGRQKPSRDPGEVRVV